MEGSHRYNHCSTMEPNSVVGIDDVQSALLEHYVHLQRFQK